MYNKYNIIKLWYIYKLLYLRSIYANGRLYFVFNLVGNLQLFNQIFLL